MPENWCPLAVLRLKAIRNAGRELSEEEEAKLPGCPWAIDHQLAHYCFFKYLSEYTSEKTISDMELAALLNVSIDTIKKIEKGALVKMRNHETLSSLKTDGEPIVTERDASHKIYR
jgi:DNA-binding XRE family transcriptional regulator